MCCLATDSSLCHTRRNMMLISPVAFSPFFYLTKRKKNGYVYESLAGSALCTESETHARISAVLRLYSCSNIVGQSESNAFLTEI